MPGSFKPVLSKFATTPGIGMFPVTPELVLSDRNILEAMSP